MFHRHCTSLQIFSAFALICVAFGFTHNHQHHRRRTSSILHDHSKLHWRVSHLHPLASTSTSTSTSLKSEEGDNQQQQGQSQSQPQYYDNYGGNFFDEISNYEDDDDEFEFPPDLEDEFEEYVPKINSVTLVGRVGQNPEPRYFNDNKVVLRLSLAVKRKYHPLERQAMNIQSGEEETDWFNLELWGRDAEYAGKYVTKGARIGISGSLNVDTWVDKITGEERWSNKILVKHLDILESRAEAELRMGNRGNYQGNQQGNQQQQQQGGYGNYNANSNSYGQGESNDYDSGPSSAGSGGFFDS